VISLFLEKLLKLFDTREKNDAEKTSMAEDVAIIRALREARSDWLQALREFENVKDNETLT
jgi:hypothetical protein